MRRRTRPAIDEYFLKIASVIGERSTCRRHHVGAVAVKHKHILATGYNGAAAGLKDCLELGCLRDELGIESGTRHEVCRGIHAEQNVIIQAAYHGISIKGSTLYCTNKPCAICTKMIINAGIRKIVYEEGYNDDLANQMLTEAGIEEEKFIP